MTFSTAPDAGKKITLKRNTPYSRTTSYQSYDNSFRPGPVNKDLDRLWLKLQELGVADWTLGNRIDALKNYVDDRDDELRAYLMEEIRKQGVALDQLDEYYNYLMERLAQIAVDKGWDSLSKKLRGFFSIKKFGFGGNGVYSHDIQYYMIESLTGLRLNKGGHSYRRTNQIDLN